MTQDTAVRKTPLFDCNKALNAKMVPFGGWMMPVSYSSVLAEHAAVRNACGLFDVSHMGEVRVRGADAAKFLQSITMNNIERLAIHGSQYSSILNERGGMIDDLIIYRLDERDYFVCVNASNTDKDFAWIAGQKGQYNVDVTNESAEWGQIAVQERKSF